MKLAVDIDVTLRSGRRSFRLNVAFSTADDRVVIFGPSGAGKSVTIQAIAGLIRPTRGRVQLGERVLFDSASRIDLPSRERRVGYLFQDYALFPHLTVEENVAFPLQRLLQWRLGDEDHRAVRDMLELFELVPLAHSLPRDLSGGQRQRVALARALAPRPRVLLLDEPLTALDARLRDTLRVEINRLLRGLGITTVYVTHDQAEAMALGDRIVVMDHGRVAQIGTPRQIYEEPRTRYVAEFIGTMNVVSGEVRADALHFPGGLLPLRNAALGGGSEAMFRPEDLALAASDGSAQFSGEVLASLFQGDHTRLEVDIGAGRPIVARIADRRDFAIGERVSFRLSTPAVRIPAQVS